MPLKKDETKQTARVLVLLKRFNLGEKICIDELLKEARKLEEESQWRMDSKYKSQSKELLNTINETGSFTTIYNNLKSLCYWDIEAECKDGKTRIEYLYPPKNNDMPHLISIPDTIDGFAHILRLYR